MIRRIAFLLSFVVLVGNAVCAQRSVEQPSIEPIQPPRLLPVRRVGKAELRYTENDDRTHARIYAYVLGASADVPERKKEVVTLAIGYSVNGQKVVQPDSFYLKLVSYSPRVPQYSENHRVTIFVDGNILLSDQGFNWYADDNPPPTASESYGVRNLGFSDFEKMAKAKTLSIQIGPNRIEINGDAMDAVRDLLKTTGSN